MKYIISSIILLSVSLSGHSQGVFGINYNINLPVGKTGDYISNVSFRGFGMEGKGFVTDNIAVGGSFDWNVLYEEVPSDQYMDGTLTITGKQYRYVNMYPLIATGSYYLNGIYSFSPYFGLGAGTVKIDKRTEMGLYSVSEENWHFGLTPEIGISYPFASDIGGSFKIKYLYAFKAGDGTAHSLISFAFGLNFF